MNETPAPRLLLIDANPESHQLLAQALENTGIKFSTAETSEDGIALAATHHYDLILLASVLPDTSGLLTLRQLRGILKTDVFPVVFLVENTEGETIPEVFLQGAVDVLRKPLHPQELQARIKSFLRNQTMLHRLRYLSLHDPITRLHNRHGMLNWIQRAKDNPSDFLRPYAALVIGVDRFNQITNLMGHGVIDELLRSVATSIQLVLSPSSEIGRCCTQCFIARVNSDSFVLLLSGVEGYRALTKLASILADSISKEYVVGDEKIFVSISIGTAIASKADVGFLELIRFAEIALRDARRAGCNHVQMYVPAMEDTIRRKFKLEDELRIATRNRGLTLEYQPVFNLPTKNCEFAEAMISWNRTNQGVYPFQPFRPIAEENGFLGEIVNWAIFNSCCQFSQWQQDLIAHAPRRISVDLTRRQLQNPHFLLTVAETIQQFGLLNHRVQFEISESEVMQDRIGMIETLRKLRDSGIRLVIDEFGTLFPAVLSMDKFPVDGIKLSPSLIQNAEGNPNVVQYIDLLIQQARQSNLAVIVDGVETEGQASIVRKLGIQFGQGNYYAKPMPADAIGPFLMDWDGNANDAKPKAILAADPVLAAVLGSIGS
jgi:diguanylate cyclase (GGDEF)-like protein